MIGEPVCMRLASMAGMDNVVIDYRASGSNSGEGEGMNAMEIEAGDNSVMDNSTTNASTLPIARKKSQSYVRVGMPHGTERCFPRKSLGII